MTRQTTIVAADPDLAPIGDDVPDQVTATDAWVLRDRAGVDPRIAEFLSRGPAPVYAGFGSMVAARSPDLAADVVAAVRAVGRRLVIAGGWAELDRHVLPVDDDVLAIGSASHEAIFPHVALAIHHGGAGTTAAAARAGVPQLLVPHVLDQFYWARRIERLGLGPRAIPVELVNADVLSARIDAALDPHIGERAAAFAPVIAGRDGVAEAVEFLERVH
jgi:vancomycin aglycone glucosyltransferase